MVKKCTKYQIWASDNFGKRRVVAIRDTKVEALKKLKQIKSIRPSARSGIGTNRPTIRKAKMFC